MKGTRPEFMKRMASSLNDLWVPFYLAAINYFFCHVLLCNAIPKSYLYIYIQRGAIFMYFCIFLPIVIFTPIGLVLGLRVLRSIALKYIFVFISEY